MTFNDTLEAIEAEVKSCNDKILALAKQCEEKMKIRSLDYASPFYKRGGNALIQFEYFKENERAGGITV